MAIALWPVATRRSAAARTADSLMSTSATAAPPAANACAAASPMPDPAPVTSATLFSNDKFIDVPLHCHARAARFVHPPRLRAFNNFRCAHDLSALAERANLLATRATVAKPEMRLNENNLRGLEG